MDLQTILSNAKQMFSGDGNIFKEGNAVGGGGDKPNDSISLKDSKGVKGGDYQKSRLQGLIKAAKTVGVDPTQLLALSWQESDFGNALKKGVAGRFGRNRGGENYLGQISDFEPEQQKELDALTAKTGIDSAFLKPAIVLRDKLKYAKQLGFNDPAMQLQAYNGYGKVFPQKDQSGKYIPTKMYGQLVPETGLDMRQNPLYGKRLLELRSDIAKNKDIQALINEKEEPLPVPTATSVASTK